MKVSGLGAVAARSVVDFFRNSATRTVVEGCLRRGVMLSNSGHRALGPLSGKTFVFTGTLQSISRSEAQGLIEQLGGPASASVSAHTNYVLAGANPGTKYARARALGVKVIGEPEFRRLVRRRREK